ncbi:MAG: TIM barrel protein, partial [Planctomycetota bacterium]|jgi:sugar phosphate isomerase/epimerase|nr:TIM barrel protein [Planctomycetota bacterium]MDP7135282.1 TIM barrel protein [Planctomycetota bacterium]MDP7253732.1 TIM barrel protein [Planctomycetota bacterium]
MIFGFSTYGMKGIATEKALPILSEIGFNAVELAVWEGWDASPDNMNGERRNTIRDLSKDHGIRISTLMENLKPSTDPDEQKKTADRLKTVAALAHELSPDDPPVIETTLGGNRWQDVKQLFVDRLPDWARIAEETETIIAIKPHRGNAMSRPEETVWLLRQLGEPKWLRMVYDYSHFDQRDMTLEETLRTSLPYISFVAIKDTEKVDGNIRFALPGDSGRIDYHKLLTMLKEGGYTGDVNCEVSAQISGLEGYDPIAAAKKCYANIAPAFEKAGIAIK